MGGALYHTSYIDDYSRHTISYFLKKRSDALKCLKEFCENIFNQTSRYPGALQTDNGSKLVNNDCKAYYSDKEITHQTMALHLPQSNGIPKRYNQTIANMCRLALCDLPPSL